MSDIGAHAASPRMKMSALAYVAVLASTECVASVAERDGDQTLLALVCGGFGVLLLLLVVSALREAVAMKRWPVAKGRVLSSTVEQYKTIAGAGNFGSSTWPSEGRTAAEIRNDVNSKLAQAGAVLEETNSLPVHCKRKPSP
jgi:hypothetical protein